MARSGFQKKYFVRLLTVRGGSLSCIPWFKAFINTVSFNMYVSIAQQVRFLNLKIIWNLKSFLSPQHVLQLDCKIKKINISYILSHVFYIPRRGFCSFWVFWFDFMTETFATPCLLNLFVPLLNLAVALTLMLFR